MAKISIITPTYNSSKFIKRTINSVINQTYKDWEYLIVDDYSTDNTVELVNEFAKKDPRIKLLKTMKNSGGPATPKNVGIENATGKYVAFLDHDDEWRLTKIEKQLNSFEKSKNKRIGIVSCLLNIKDNNGNLLYKHKENYKNQPSKHLANGNFIVTSSCVMTKLSILKEVGLFDPEFRTSDDWDMWVKISEKGYEFDFIPEYLVDYIIHGSNACYGNNSNKNKEELALIYKKHENLFIKYNSKIAGNFYFNLKKYRLARKYFLKNIFLNKSNTSQKLKSTAFIILTFCPNLENLARKIWQKIKNYL
jgi:teichuronic acid biosynthesis glycosyltransferase TuaG